MRVGESRSPAPASPGRPSPSPETWQVRAAAPGVESCLLLPWKLVFPSVLLQVF